MKKHLFLLITVAFMITASKAQVAIKPAGSGTTADPSAMLDVQSTNKGALLPRMTATQRLAIANPAIGLMVYDTDSSAFMLKNASGWVKLQSTSDVAWKKSGNDVYNTNSGKIGINMGNLPLTGYGSSLNVLPGNNADGITVESSNQNNARAINASSYANQGIGVSAGVTGTNGTGVIATANGASSVGVQGWADSSNSTGVYGKSSKGTAGAFFTTSGFGLQVDGGTTGQAILVHRGNTGLGVTLPKQMLEVAGAVKLADTVTTSTATNGTIRYNATQGFQGKHGNSWQNLGESGSSQWITSGNNIYNNNTGRVGIGLDSAGLASMSNGNLTNNGNLNVFSSGIYGHPAIRVNGSGANNPGIDATTDGANVSTINGDAYGIGSTGVSGFGSYRGVSGYSDLGTGGVFGTQEGTALRVNNPRAGIYTGNALIVTGGNSAFGSPLPFPNTMLYVAAEGTNNTGAYIAGNGNGAALITTGRVGINTLTPWSDAALDVNGDMYIRGGNPGAGKVLTSNADGKASWEQPSGGTLYTAGTGINISGTNVISSTAPTYTAGDGINISGNTISSTTGGWTYNGGNILQTNPFADHSVVIGTDNATAFTRLSVVGSANVPIAAKFIAGTSSAYAVTTTGSISVGGGLKLDNIIAAAAGTIRYNGTDFEGTTDGANWKSLTGANIPSYWTLGAGNTLSNTNSGNIGIGVANPAAKLDVSGAIKIGDLQGNPSNGSIAYTGTDFMGFHNGWKSLTTGTTYTAGSGINISGTTISTTPQTLSISGSNLTLSNGGGTVALPGGGGSSQFTATGNDIYNSNSGKVLIGSTTANGTAKLQVEDATNFGTTAQVLSRNAYSTSLYVADSAVSGNPVGCDGCAGNIALRAYSNVGTALLAKSANGIGAYIRGGNSSEPAVKIENPGGSSLLGLQVHGGVDITGYLHLNDGTQQAGRVLTTDANGYASWQAPTGGGTTYSAGTGINISGGTISTNLTGGSGINISGNTISSALQAGSGISISGNTITATGVTGAGGWLKTGTDVSLQNTTDYVGIGTAGNAGAKLRVVSNNEAGISVISGGPSTNAIFASVAGTDAIAANLLAGAGAKGLSVSSINANAAEFFSQNAAAISVNPTGSTSKIAIVVPFDNSGFGTTNPTDKVHIVGGATLRYQDGNEAAGKVLTSDANGRASWQTPATGGATAWSVDAGNNIYNSSTTNSTVGIGLSSVINTAYQLHTRSIKSGGAIALFQSNQSNANIALANSTGIAGSFFTNGTDFGLNSNTISGTPLNLSLNVAGLSGLMIDGTTRNVSLGGTIANESLVTSGGLRLGNSTGANAGTLRYDGSDLQGYVGGAWKSLTGNGLWQLNNNNAYLASGKVGIGTTTPTEKLEVNGAIKIGTTFTSNAGTIRYGANGNIFEGFDGTNWKSMFSKWNVTASNNIYSDATQNVGIGVQDGQQKLEVDGGVKIGTTAINTSGTVRFENNDFEGFDGSEWKTLTGKDYFAKNATSVFLYDANKNLGVGVASPIEKLEVNGGLKIGTATATPTAGTMQYSAGLQVHDGTNWVSLNPQFNLDGSNNLSNTTAANYGLGTATPVEKLEVNGGIKVGASFGTNEGTIRYTSNEFEGFDGTAWKSLTGKGLWNKVGADLSLATTTDNVGIGTTTPAGKLQIENSGTQLIVKETSATAAKINFMNDGTSNFWGLNGYSDATNTSAGFNINYSGNNLFTVNGAGDAILTGTLTQASDIRLKRNIAPLGSVLDKLKNVGAYTYNWKDEKKDQQQQIGFLAQELEKEFPQLVKTDAKDAKSVAYGNMVPVLLQAIKEQQAEIDALKKCTTTANNQTMNAELQKMNAENAQLKQQMNDMMKKFELLEKMVTTQTEDKAKSQTKK